MATLGKRKQVYDDEDDSESSDSELSDLDDTPKDDGDEEDGNDDDDDEEDEDEEESSDSDTPEGEIEELHPLHFPLLPALELMLLLQIHLRRWSRNIRRGLRHEAEANPTYSPAICCTWLPADYCDPQKTSNQTGDEQSSADNKVENR
jgi:hypothetical protein